MHELLELHRKLDALPWREATLGEWELRLGGLAEPLRPFLKLTGALAESYPCPHGGDDGCPRTVFARAGGTFEAVCGNVPSGCAAIPLKKQSLAVHRLDDEAALTSRLPSVCEREYLETTTLAPFEGLLPLGSLERSQGRALVVLASPRSAARRAAVLELRRRAAVDGVIALVAGRHEDRRFDDGIVELGLEAGADAAIWRGVRLLWPEAWATRASMREAIFEEVTLEFASREGEHVVRLNGCELKHFRASDAKFARLLVLAAARASGRDVAHGGWVKKLPHLELDDGEVDLVEVRKAFHHDLDADFARLPIAERKELIKGSTSRPGELRLALHPKHIRFDASLASLRLLGERTTTPKQASEAKKKPSSKPAAERTENAKTLVRNQAQARAKALKMFAFARKHGVPLPSEAELRG